MKLYVCQKIFLTPGVFMMYLGFAVVIWTLLMILRELKRIERKTYHHDDRPKSERFWGNGIKK